MIYQGRRRDCAMKTVLVFAFLAVVATIPVAAQNQCDDTVGAGNARGCAIGGVVSSTVHLWAKLKQAHDQREAERQAQAQKIYATGNWPLDATAVCKDGWIAFNDHFERTCSHHGGIGNIRKAAEPGQLPQADLTWVRARLSEPDVQRVVNACASERSEGLEVYNICLEYQTQMKQLSNGVPLPVTYQQVQKEHDDKLAAYLQSGQMAGSSTATSTVERDSQGRIKRSESARNAFMHDHPCPSTGQNSGSCPGYVIDHIDPLECGGADAPSNMQWQTIADAKAKDKTERYCRPDLQVRAK